MPLRVIQGDTFAPVFRRLNGKTREPIDLTGSTLTLSVYSADRKFDADILCEILDQSIPENLGRYLANPVDTSNWPVGQLTLKASREFAGAKASIIGMIVVEAG